MNEYSIDSVLKREFPELKDDNSKSFRISKELFIMVAKHSREMVKFAKDEWEKALDEKKEKEAKRVAEASGGLEYRADMTDEELREMFKRQIFKRGATGDFDGSIAGRLIDVFNLKSEKKETIIEPVKFEEAYPDYAAAIAISEKPIPVIP